MEILVILLLIILFFIILSFKNSTNQNIDKLTAEVRRLRDQLEKNAIQNRPSSTAQSPVTPIQKEVIKPKEYWESGFKVENESLTDPPQAAQEEARKKEQAEKLSQLEELRKQRSIKSIEIKETIKQQQESQPTPVPQPTFFERHPDLEKFIGENLINKIGIAILVLAIGFFVKYAIDKNWVGPVGRVGIGILCGGILVAIGHRLRKNYKAFSSVLVGGGLAVFYFTIALAYHEYHLFSQAMSFIIMVVITIFAVVLSMLYNRQELAIIALVGGFVTPFLVSDGSGNFKTLFTYLIILNAGLLVIAYNKAWRILNILAFAFTVILFASWVLMLSDNEPRATYMYGFLFSTIFYLLFFVINIANNVKENKRFIGSDFSILLLNTSLYFAAGLFFITSLKQEEYRGLFTAALGVLNLVASFLLLRKQKVDRNILYLLIGITISFISLTAPVQLKGNYITLFWASECVLLYWLYQRSKISIIRMAAFMVWIAMIISLAIDWGQLYIDKRFSLPIIFNKGFITTLYAAIASYLLFILRKKDGGEEDRLSAYLLPANGFRVAGLILLFLAGALEINYQFLNYYPNYLFNIQYLLLYTYAFVLVFSIVTSKVQNLSTPVRIQFVLFTACFIIYVASINDSFDLSHQLLRDGRFIAVFGGHWFAVLLAGVIFVFTVQLVKKNFAAFKNSTIITWLLCAWLVIFLSAETWLLANNVFYEGEQSVAKINRVFIKAVLPILWGLCSFLFMWLGMRHKYRALRIVSLTLFSITLIKLFVFDIRNIPAGGKIAAFFCLGVLLLVVSFMYQRLKQIIIEDEQKAI